MQLVQRKSGVGYYDTHLWLPKTHIAEMQIASALTYDRGEFKAPIRAWREERDHFVVPRNYMLPGALPRLPFPVFDSRIRSFPRVDWKSNVKLDAKNLQKTFQREGNAALLRNFDGILCLRCGAGKTIVGIHSASLLHVPTLVLVDTADLAEQWEEEVLEFTDLKKEDIGRVGGGKFDWQKPFTIAVIHTIAARASEHRLPLEMLSFFGLLMPDECHLLGAPYFNLAVPPFHGRRWGLSATPRRNDDYDSLLRYTMGEVLYQYLEPELIPQVYFKQLYTKIDYADVKTQEAIQDVKGEVHLRKM